LRSLRSLSRCICVVMVWEGWSRGDAQGGEKQNPDGGQCDGTKARSLFLQDYNGGARCVVTVLGGSVATMLKEV
jgi:hypothetical protein